jgi:hypothetical protein
MNIMTRSFIKGFLACLLLLSFMSVLYAAEDKRFALKDGVIDDAKLGLQWAPAPDRPMNHYQAEEYARNLRLAGGGWRLPSVSELKSVYDKNKLGGADPMFKISDYLVWTSYLDGTSYAGYIVFNNGQDGLAARDTLLPYIRVLAVRSRR